MVDCLGDPLSVVAQFPPTDGILGVALHDRAGSDQLRAGICQLVGCLLEGLRARAVCTQTHVLYKNSVLLRDSLQEERG